MADADRDVVVELGRRVGAGEAVVVATAVRTEGAPPCRPGQKLLVGPAGPIAGTLGCAEFDARAADDAPGTLAGAEPALRTYEHDLGRVEVHLEPYPARSRLVVLGATPVARFLLRWAGDLGYDAVPVQPRSERVTPEHREAARAVAASPAEAGPSGGGATDAVHTDHDAPLVVEHLAELLRAGTRFVGLVASARHAGAYLDALRDLGVAEADVARVRTPVGLDLGGRSAPEVALSILAGLVAARTGRAGGWLDRRDGARADGG